MKSKLFKRFVPMILGGVAMLVLAVPMTASAREWGHHDNGNHNGWVHRDNGNHGWAHRDRDDFHRWNDHDRDDFHRHWDRDDYEYAPRAYYPSYSYPRNYAYGPAYGNEYVPYGYAGGGCNMTHLENVYRHDRRTGHPAAANDVARRMRSCGGGLYGQNGYYGNGYYGQNSVFQPLGNMFGLW